MVVMLKMCVTGHRPSKLPDSKTGYDRNNETRVWVRNAMREVLSNIRPNYAYIGMALGADQDFAEVCIEKKIPFDAVVPFRGQESLWPEVSQLYYWDLMRQAVNTHIVCEPGYAAWKMQRRNEEMINLVDKGKVIAVWDGSQGGTANCVKYAKLKKLDIIRIDPNIKTIKY